VYLTDVQARGYVEVCKGEVEKAEQAAKDADVVRDTKVEQAKDVAKVGERGAEEGKQPRGGGVLVREDKRKGPRQHSRETGLLAVT
jgi:hypothetical protein